MKRKSKEYCLSVWIDEELYNNLNKYATEFDTNMSIVARSAIRRYLNEQTTKK